MRLSPSIFKSKIMTKKNILILIFSSLFIYSCCTKKNCEYHDYPSIIITLVDFPVISVDRITIDNSTNQVIDSSHVDFNNFGFSHLSANDMRGKTFIIKTNKPSIDTITNISYEINTFINNCNNCFLANGGAEATEYSNLQYTINGITYFNPKEFQIHY